MKKVISVILCLLTIFMGFVTPVKVAAKTLNDMYGELAALENKKKFNDNKKNLTTDQMNEAKRNIEKTNRDIEQASIDIAKAEQQIEESEIKIKEKDQETKDLMKFLQMSDTENLYLEYLFGAEDYTDFIYRYSVVEQLTKHNDEILKEMEQLITENEKLKVNLSAKQIELKNSKATLGNQLDSLGNQLSEITEVNMDITDEIKAIKDIIKAYEDMGCKPTQNITTCSKTPVDTGWKFPLKSGYVTSNYGSRSDGFHNGIDIGGNSEGTSVMAPAAGVVVGVTLANVNAYKKSCGGNMVFLHHIVNGKTYTTCYMHLLTVEVSVGDVVQKGQRIGGVGGSSTSYYDRCTTGAHLHFATAEGFYLGLEPGSYTGWSTFVNHTFNPRNILPFPQEGAGRFYR